MNIIHFIPKKVSAAETIALLNRSVRDYMALCHQPSSARSRRLAMARMDAAAALARRVATPVGRAAPCK